MEGTQKIDLVGMEMECSPSVRVEAEGSGGRSVLKNYLICSLGVVWEDLAPHLLSALEVPVSMHDFMGVTVFDHGYQGVFTTSFGPGGVFTNVRRDGGNAQEASSRPLLLQLLPLIILFGFSLLSALPNLFTTPPVPDPRFAFASSTRYNVQRETNGLKIPYFVNQGEFQKHPVIGAELARDVSKTSKGPALKKFESTVEQVYTRDLYVKCQHGVDRKTRLKEGEIGLFGIGTDWEKVRRIEQEPIESCEELKRLGVI